MTSLKCALIIGDQCLDIRGILLEKGIGLLCMEDDLTLEAGDLPLEKLWDLLELLRQEIRFRTITPR